MIMRKNLHNSKKGFTLVETMVAISVLMFAILGPLSIASSGLMNARIARDQVTAFYLAQEGLEFVRYVRDTNYLDDPTSTDEGQWLADLGDCMASEGCQIDVASYFATESRNLSEIISRCDRSGCFPLGIDEVTGLYTYNNSDRYSPFTRTVRVTEIGDANNEIHVEATVSWQTGLSKKEVVLSENVRNIYGQE